MSFKEVSGARNYRAWDQWGEGEFITGKYSATGDQPTAYGDQKWYEIEVDDSNFPCDGGKTLRLNGCGALDSKMAEIEVGSIIKVQYDGEGVMPKGPFKGKPFKDIKVFVADEDTKVESSSDYSGL